MKMKAWAFVIVSLAPLVIFLVSLYFSLAPLQTPPADAQAGRHVWISKGCMECHSIFGDGGYGAKDITNEYSERGPEWLSAFLQWPPMVAGGHRHPVLSGEALQRLLSFFRYIDELPISEWPPTPLLHLQP